MSPHNLRPPRGHPRPSSPRPHLLPHQDALLDAGSIHLGLLAPHLLPQHLGLRLGALQRAPQLRDLPIQPLRREEMLWGGSFGTPPDPPTRPRTHRHLPALVDEIQHVLLLLFQDVLQHLLVLQGTKCWGREGVRPGVVPPLVAPGCSHLRLSEPGAPAGQRGAGHPDSGCPRSQPRPSLALPRGENWPNFGGGSPGSCPAAPCSA